MLGCWIRGQRLVEAHEEFVEKKCGRAYVLENLLVMIYALWRDNLRRNEEVVKIINEMNRVAVKLRARARELDWLGRLYVSRLARRLESSLRLATYLYKQSINGRKVVEKLVLHWNDKGLIGLPGGKLAGLIDDLVKGNISVAVVTTGIVSSRVAGYDAIVLHPSLERTEYRVLKMKRVYRFNATNSLVRMRNLGLAKLLDISLLSTVLGYLLKREDSDVLVVSKAVLLKLLKTLPKERVRVYGDVKRGVID